MWEFAYPRLEALWMEYFQMKRGKCKSIFTQCPSEPIRGDEYRRIDDP
jgi:hypothetical protein